MKKSKIVTLLAIGWLSLSSCGETSSLASSETPSVYSSVSSSEEESTSSTIVETSFEEISSEVESSEETTSIDYSVQAVEFIGTPSSINIGDTYQLSWVVIPSFAKNKSVTFISSNNSIASVSALGVVSALSNGTVSITVTTEDGSMTDNCSIDVITPEAQLLKFTNEITDVYLDSQLQLTWKFTPSIIIDGGVKFEVSTPEVLSVDENGLVTPVSEGSSMVLIRNTSDTVSDTITITILPTLVEHVSSLLEKSLENETTSLISGTSQITIESSIESSTTTEAFEVYSDNEILIDSNYTSYDSNNRISNYIDYKRYQGYLENDAYYEITDYFIEDDLDYENVLNRYPLGNRTGEISEGTALTRSNLYNSGNDSTYGISNMLKDKIANIPSDAIFSNSYNNLNFTIDAEYTDNENTLTEFVFLLNFDENGSLTSASTSTSTYDISLGESEKVLTNSTREIYELTYGERQLPGALIIDPNNYYFSSYDFYLSYNSEGDNEEDTLINNEKVPLGSYIYCIVQNSLPNTAIDYDRLNFISSSNSNVVNITTPNNQVNCRSIGTTTLTVTSVRGILHTVDITVI